MLGTELQNVRDDTVAIMDLLTELEKNLALPLPPEPPFQVISDVTALHDRVYDMARRVGRVKQIIRDKVLQHTLAADMSP